ncbi:MAG: hypothetical protein A2085_01895 [Gemmatimonadetes bacterium GWC2_71_10]|nr:MAG: hypothetical protein A2085_01895 [Gemmatimonadetes bacterium GWC2_71_10]
MAMSSTTSATPPTTSGSRSVAVKPSGPRDASSGPSTTVAAVSWNREPARTARSTPVAAPSTAAAFTPAATRTSGVRPKPLPGRTHHSPRDAGAASSTGSHTSAALGSAPENPGGAIPTIV